MKKEERERKDAEAQKKVQDDEKKMSSFDNSAYCRFRIKNGSSANLLLPKNR